MIQSLINKVRYNMADKFTWLKFYIELANKLLLFKNNRTLLVEKLREAHKVANKELPKIESDNNNVPNMDPFTVFALFNRENQSVETRIELCKAYKEVFKLEESVFTDICIIQSEIISVLIFSGTYFKVLSNMLMINQTKMTSKNILKKH